MGKIDGRFCPSCLCLGFAKALALGIMFLGIIILSMSFSYSSCMLPSVAIKAYTTGQNQMQMDVNTHNRVPEFQLQNYAASESTVY